MNVVNSFVCDCEAKINEFLLLFIPSDAWYNQENLLLSSCAEKFLVIRYHSVYSICADVVKAVSKASFTAVGIL